MIKMNECPGLVNIRRHESQSTFCDESRASGALRHRDADFMPMSFKVGERGLITSASLLISTLVPNVF